MPRLATIHHPALRAIAEDQRYAPKAAALRAVERIERLASEIEAQARYPRDYVVYRVTGYQPRTAEIELVAGDALLADLSALAETLSSHAHLPPGDVPEGALGVDELCARWSVARRTVERDRRRGLIARRVRDGGSGNELLYFTRPVVEAFERAHPERDPEGGGPPGRLTEGERAEIRRRAERYESSLDLSRSAIAGRIASRIGRSVNAVRRVLDERDEEERRVLDGRARRLLMRRWERGTPIQSLEAWAGRSRATVHRAVQRARLDRLERVGAPEPAGDPRREEDALDAPVAQSGLLVPAPPDVAGVLGLREAMGRATESQERALALAARAAWRRCASLVRTLEREAPPAHLVDRAETDARWAGLLRERVTWFALPLVVRTIEDRAEAPLIELPPMFAMRLVEGGMARAATAAGGYDATRAGRLAGRASLAVDRYVVGELASKRRLREAGAATRREDVTPGGWRDATRLGEGVVDVPGWLVAGLDRVAPDPRSLVEARFGLLGDRPRTIIELAEERGETVRSVWRGLHNASRAARGG